MPRASGVTIENNFVKGHVTEYTGLNFPENAVTDSDNCIFNEKGRAFRRLGLDREADATTLSASRTGNALSNFLWESAGGQSTTNIVVQQIGKNLKFYLQGLSSLSAGYVGTLDFSIYKVVGNPDVDDNECLYASGLGSLVISHPYCDPFYVDYAPATQTITSARVTLSIRDTKGIEDGFVSRIPTATQAHLYNLRNQGWAVSPNAFGDPILQFRALTGYYPSDGDVWWLFKNAQDQFDGSLFNTNVRGNSPAPRGYYILDAFNQDRSGLSGVAGLDIVTSNGARPRCVEWFAGRAFYAGVDQKNFSSSIYFTKIVESTADLGLCYQVNDGTSEHSSDLLPSDGGVIVIPEIGSIFRLWSIQGSLIVFASNGVWSISGSTGIGFTATDFTIRKIAATRTVGASAFVNVAGYPLWWSSESIYGITLNQIGSTPVVKSLTDDTFRTFYQAIPDEAKKYVRGCFDPIKRVVQWIYRDTAPTTVEERYQYNRVLNFNVLSGGFYTWTINTTDVSVGGIVCVGGQSSELDSMPVTNSALVTVTDHLGATVTVNVLETEQRSYVTKFLISYDNSGTVFTFAESFDSNHVDFSFFYPDPTTYLSYFFSGYQVRADAIRNFQTNYIAFFSDTNGCSAFVQPIWNYALSGNTGRWGSRQRVTFDDSNYTYLFKRLKFRGSGKAMQIRVTSDAGNPFNFIGWSQLQTGNNQV